MMQKQVTCSWTGVLGLMPKFLQRARSVALSIQGPRQVKMGGDNYRQGDKYVAGPFSCYTIGQVSRKYLSTPLNIHDFEQQRASKEAKVSGRRERRELGQIWSRDAQIWPDHVTNTTILTQVGIILHSRHFHTIIFILKSWLFLKHYSIKTELVQLNSK